MRFAYSKGLRPLAAVVAGLAMLGAVAITPIADAQDVTASDLNGLRDAVSNGGTVTLTDNINGWTGNGLTGYYGSELHITQDTTINGGNENHRLQGVSVIVENNATLTVNNVVVDDVRDTVAQLVPAVTPYDVQSGTLNFNDSAAITDNGSGTSYGINVGAGATANVKGTHDVYDDTWSNNGYRYSSVYGSDYGIYGAEGSTITITAGDIVAENNDSGNEFGGVVSSGTVNLNGGRAQSVIVRQPGVLNLNGGTIDKSLQSRYDTNELGADAALSVKDNASAYLIKGAINSDSSGVNSYPLNLKAQAKVYAQAAADGDVTVDGTNLYIAKAHGNNDGFLTDPTVSADYRNIPGAIADQKLYVNYGDVSTLHKLVANEASSKVVLNQAVDNESTITSGYLGYHGELNIYGRYALKSTTLNQGQGTVTVYGVPAAADYEWYSKPEVVAKHNAKTYPDAKVQDQSYEAAGYKGRKFAGWFKSGRDFNASSNTDDVDVTKDANYTAGTGTQNVDGSQTTGKFAWAHFANAKNQSIGVQTSKNGTTLRFLTAIDSLKYRNVNFKIAWQYGNLTDAPNKGEGTLDIDHVYQSVSNVTPADFPNQTFGTFGNGPAAVTNNQKGYFATALLRGIPDGYLNNSFFGPFKVTVTPSWTTLDGTVVTGEPVYKEL